MGIKVGEYARTKNGDICKVVEVNKAGFGVRYYGEDIDKTYCSVKPLNDDIYLRFEEKSITRHSPKIIDLIQERRLCQRRKDNLYWWWYFV